MNNIEKQYKTSQRLDIRIAIHKKYSTNQQPFGEWIHEKYEISPGFHILELGCGTGDMWKGNLNTLPDNTQLILSDFSEGMLDAAKKNLANHPTVRYQKMDIQSIPYADASFDMVIANMMLYHVLDLHRGLSEVRRVLKPGGKFYCATYGEHGIMEFVNDALFDLNVSGSIGKQFTLQNGEEILSNHFSNIRKLTRDDGLCITSVDDFIEYVLSLNSLTGLESVTASMLKTVFSAKMKNGILYVPKEYGMFICE